MDNDSAHHADIALRMYLTGDYVNLIDQGGDYLDKPHFLFWAAAFSYKIFGVTSFAYRLPSFLFTIVGVYSTYRLGKKLYNKETGKLAALLLASSFAFILANNDVRMEAILTASIAFSCWQLTEFVNNKKPWNAVGAALGLAIGFSTKGHIAIFVPTVFIFFYILYQKNWKIFLNWKWLLLLLTFGILISPVVYCYYLQYNLHPEKVIRGKDHINGVKFILLNQSVERFVGGMGNDAGKDYFFFLHSFLWAFAPWSILTYMAIAGRIKYFLGRKLEWGTLGAFILMAVAVSLSGFKLPHYLNVVFPLAAIMAAVFVIRIKPGWIKAIFTIQLIICGLLLLLSAIVNAWVFPLKGFGIIITTIVLLAIVFYFLQSTAYNHLQKIVVVPIATMALLFFLLNSNFYPHLLKYQAGQNLAKSMKGTVDPADVYEKPNSYSASYIFYSKSQFKPFNDSLLLTNKSIWLLTEPDQLEQVKQEGYRLGKIYPVVHFRISKLSLKFLNPSTRDRECSEMMLVEITGKSNLNINRNE